MGERVVCGQWVPHQHGIMHQSAQEPSARLAHDHELLLFVTRTRVACMPVYYDWTLTLFPRRGFRIADPLAVSRVAVGDRRASSVVLGPRSSARLASPPRRRRSCRPAKERPFQAPCMEHGHAAPPRSSGTAVVAFFAS